MRKRWYLLAALVGGLAAFAVWVWPQKPLWRSGPEVGMPQHFSPDSRVLVTLRVRTPESQGDPLPVISRWDAATGKLLGRVQLDRPGAYDYGYVRPSPDGTMILVDEGLFQDINTREYNQGRCYLYDGITGKLRRDLLPGMDFGGTFSPDSCWFWGYRGEPRGTDLASLGVIFCSAETGEPVFEVRNTEQQNVGGCVFALDSRTVAIELGSGGLKRANNLKYVLILEIPSGREVCRLELPEGNWIWVERWDGQYLEVAEGAPDAATGGYLQRGFRFEVLNGTLGEAVEQPYRRALHGGSANTSFWHAGPGWVADCRAAPPPTPPPAWWAWVLSLFGINQGPAKGLLITARVMDPATGATRYELPYPVKHPIKVSPDGRLLACCGSDASVHVWDMAPPPRWPRAAALGAAVAGSVLGLGWWKRAKAKSSRV